MDRIKLEQKAFEIARSDMMNINENDEELKTAIAQCIDSELISYLTEMEGDQDE